MEESQIKEYEVIIIGGGPAGLTAALYAARGGLKVLILEEGAPGGQAALTDKIENYPGFPQGISGIELMQKFVEQAKSFGTEIKMGHVLRVEFEGEEKKIYVGEDAYKTPAVILATGAKPKSLGVRGEKRFLGRGVSYCATCDGAFFKDKKVAVIGGGDSALEEAIFLTHFAKEVIIIHRREGLRAVKILQDRTKANPKISFRLSTVVEEILGEDKVEALKLKNVKDDTVSIEPLDGVFIFIGNQPATSFVEGILELDPLGYIITDEDLKTSREGVFACGDVRRKSLRQVATAVGDGALAGMSAVHYLEERDRK